ncbi:hypothetical protein DAEQUDRAFT_814089 [Daedalea quercina L-15889]|uniref:Uncharacterized protein n=1 Tax=Daedalea quercina L-15889 TaxID=1314783 RepID=A0A165MHD1_9APHY|nr:hypothetical protein DAEQUDRAFT_814089 [Daedalea quercina L-15889]
MPPQRTLVQVMQNLNLEPASEDRESEKAVPPHARQSSGRSKTYRWPKLPEGWHEQDRHFVLGWNLKHPRLQEFVGFTTPENLVILPYSLRAADYLEAASGWPHIHVCSVLPQDVNPPEPWSDPNGPRETIIAIAFTGSRRLY